MADNEEIETIQISDLTANPNIEATDIIYMKKSAGTDVKATMQAVKAHIYPPEASATQAGIITTGIQTLKGDKTLEGDLHISGDIFQEGESYEVEVETLKVKDQLITTRDGATTAMAANEVTGIKAEKYDGTNNGLLVFDVNGVARVGDENDTQPLATREETPTDKSVQIWDAVNQRLKSVAGSNAGDILQLDDNGNPEFAPNPSTIHIDDETAGTNNVYSASKTQNLFNMINPVVDFSQTNKGYVKFPNGLLIQWVKNISVSAGAAKEQTLPQAYASASSYAVIATNSLGYNFWCTASPNTASSVKVGSVGSDGYHSGNVNIITIGYYNV